MQERAGDAQAPRTADQAADGHLLLTPDELEWGPVASMGEGAEIAFYERVTVLSGTLRFAHGERFDRRATRALPPGSLAIMPPGDPMFGYAEGEVVIQLHGTGPWGIEYLDPADDPRR